MARQIWSAEERRSFVDCCTLRRESPLTLLDVSQRARFHAACATPSPLWNRCTSMRPAPFASSKCLPSKKPQTSTLARPAPATRIRWPTNEGSARFHRCSKTRLDPSADRFRGRFKAACAFTTSAENVSTSTVLDCTNISGARKPCAETIAIFDPPLPLDRKQPPRFAQGQGSRITEPRHSLLGLLPKETSPQPRAPQTPRVARVIPHLRQE
jgi:hypothetical protein